MNATTHHRPGRRHRTWRTRRSDNIAEDTGAETRSSTKELIIPSHYFSLTVHDDFDAVVKRTREALASHGFGVLTEIDFAATMKAKLDIDREPYLILGACNPPYANQVVNADPTMGTLLPCNVVVRADGDDTVVIDFMDPNAVMAMTDHKGIAKVAHDVRSLMEQVRDDIAKG